MTDLRDKIARALFDYTVTAYQVPESDMLRPVDFRNEADAVLAVLDLDTERAEAWDEGHESAAMRVPECVWFDTAAPHPGNPYRKAEQ